MSNPSLLAYIIHFLLYVSFQVVIIRHTNLGGWAFCFPYLGYLMMLPFNIGQVTIMLTGFLLGIIVDIFYNSLGIHAAATVLVAYLRKYFINLNTPIGGYDVGMAPTIKSMGFRWFLIYALLILFVHHLTLLLIEASNFALIWYSLGKTIGSVLFTFGVLIIIQYLFYYPTKRR
ncbi:MAG: Rod shape-determining protein MreD [Cytophagales bacterium]|nr:Rod shape-determining protein MreD [Cytophagales bacterium]MDW8384124.1 Rod shape-determining protein MreD [Flammeovirgaceae bacterium]